jgi:hypothetical protein
MVLGIFPWYNIVYDKEYNIIKFKPCFKFGNNIIKSYENHEYNKSFCHRLFSCFYCKSSCFEIIDDGNPFTRERSDMDFNLEINNKIELLVKDDDKLNIDENDKNMEI